MSVATHRPKQRSTETQSKVPDPLGMGAGRTGVTAPVQPKSLPAARSKRPLVIGSAAIIVAVIGIAAVWRIGGSDSVASEDLVFHQVTRGDLEITVIERGNLESQRNLEILCEVDDVRRDGINGTPLVWIIPNGARVKKGDLLVELDSAPIQEQLDEQILETEQAREKFMLAQAKYDNQITQNETNEAEAALQVELASLELKMFADKDNGTHKLEVEAIKRQIDDLNNDILAAQASLELRRNDKQAMEQLFRLGYAAKSELDRSRLDFLQAESAYAAKFNRLNTELSTLSKKETYERKMAEMRLEGKLKTAERGLAQVIRNNEAQLTQAKTSLETRRELLHKEQELLARYEEQLEKCKILAPQDGMVAYASSRNEQIRAGIPVRARQHILSLPDLSAMQVVTSIHESVLNQVHPGLKTTIRVDAFPDDVFRGTVKAVAVLPDQTGWFNSDTKAYATTVVIDQEVENLKPGMTAVVEIHVDHLKNILAVPVQAIVQEGKATWCYVACNDGKLERRDVKLGATNDRVVQVLSGIREGDSVVLNPGALTKQESERKQDRKKDEKSGTA